MSNPDLPDGAINGTRWMPDDEFDWTQPDSTVIHITPADEVEFRFVGSDVWLNVKYAQSSIDALVAIETARAEAAETTAIGLAAMGI